MNLEEALLKEHSFVQATKISYWAVESKTNLKQLMQVFFGKEKILVQRASWAASKAYDINP